MGTLSVDKLMKTSTGAAEFTLPATDGTANQVMQTDGSGQLSLANYTGPIATDAVDSAQIAANAVGTTEVADNAITANKLANSAYEAGDNKIINGQYDVWQRGTTVNVTANANVYYCDMWRHEGFAFTGSVSRQTFTNGQTDVPDNPTYYARLIITTNAAGYQAFVQRIENNPVNRFSGKTIVVSFWIKSVSGTLADGTVRAYGKGSLTSGSDNIGAITTSWQKIEYTGTLGTLTGSYYTAGLNISQGTLLTSGVDIANFQVEVGDTATPFEQKTYGQELAACKRYYQKASTTTPFTGQCTSGQTYGGEVYFPVTMRGTPAVVQTHVTSSSFPGTTPTSSEIQATKFYSTKAADGTANVGFYRMSWTADAGL